MMVSPLTVVVSPRDTVREEVWLRAWNSVAGVAGLRDATPYADACLTDFDERFPDPAKTWRERDKSA